jgi:heat shock protein 90kDa beta
MAPVLSGTLGASSVAALRPCAGRRAPSAATPVTPRLSGSARSATGVRWAADKRGARTVMVRCDAAVAEKPAGEEAAEEKFEYQAEVRHGHRARSCFVTRVKT